MKKLGIFLISILIFTFSLVGCQTQEISTEEKEANKEEYEISEEKIMEVFGEMLDVVPPEELLGALYQIIDEPVADAIELYFIANSMLMYDNLEEVEEAEQEINRILSKFHNSKSDHAFSKEAEDIINQMTFLAQEVIKLKKSEIEKPEIDEDAYPEYFDGITKIGELMSEYEKLYIDYKYNN